jgi:hypothetical protein
VILLLWLACAVVPPEVDARAIPGGFDVVADAPLAEVEVLDANGVRLARRRLPTASTEVWLDVPWVPGATYTIRADGEAGGTTIREVVAPAEGGPVRLSVEAPLGQDAREVKDGDHVPVLVVAGSAVEVGIVATAVVPGDVSVRMDDGTPHGEAWAMAVPGERRVAVTTLDAKTTVAVTAGGSVTSFVLDPVALSREEAARRLSLTRTTFPAEPTGEPDLARPLGRVSLPAGWWEEAMRGLGLGFRAPDHQAPWGLAAVELANAGDAALNVVIETRVLDSAGRPVHAFRPRLRERDTGVDHVAALVRVPASSHATTVLPVFVDRREVEEGEYTYEIAITPLGSPEPLHVARQPLYVVRGSSWASIGVVASVAAAAAGLLWLARGLPRWLREWPTSDLTTIALFGSLQLVVGLAAQVAATVTTALVGPFSPLLTGLIDDAMRAALLATLISLLPRPGTASLSLVIGFLLRVLALGAVTPLDPIYVGASVAWLEGFLWLSGLTRSGAWREEGPLARWIRLSVALAGSSVLGAATALAAHVWFYRLFYADWYVLSVLALPSCLYVVVACWLAVRFSDALRRVEA